MRLLKEGVGEAIIGPHHRLRHLRWGLRFGLLGGWSERGREDLDEFRGKLGAEAEGPEGDFGGEGFVAVADDGGDAGQASQFLRGARA